MMFLRGLSGTVSLWLFAVFCMVAFVGWHQLRDIATIHDKALQLEAVNHRSHALHALEMRMRQRSAYVHDFLIAGSDVHVRMYRDSRRRLEQDMRRTEDLGIAMDGIREAVTEIDTLAERIFALPRATDNMEGPILMQELDDRMAELAALLTRRHHAMDDTVNDAMRLVAGLHLDLRDDFIASLLVLFVLLVGMTTYIYTRMIRPLVWLRRRVARIGEGTSQVSSPDLGRNELGDLARAIDTMDRSIRAHQEDLARARSLQAHREKMQALGLMTANIAHEVGNPLSAALVSLEMAARHARAGRMEALSEQLHIATEELHRTEAIIRNILEFSRPARSLRERIDLCVVIDSSMQLVQLARHARRVAVRFDAPATPLFVHGSVDMLRQVLVNLLINAIDASREGSEVCIRVDADSTWVRLDIEDQGCGIESEYVDEIFSPFFSTKQVGQGTGLGLSISRDLVRQMQGELSLLSNGPRGCVFRLSLPSAMEERAC